MALVRRSNLAYCRQFLINYEFYSGMNEKIKVIVDTLQNASGQILSLDLLSHLIFKPLNHLPISIYKTVI